MRTILNSEIRKERCNAAALGAYNASVGVQAETYYSATKGEITIISNDDGLIKYKDKDGNRFTTFSDSPEISNKPFNIRKSDTSKDFLKKEPAKKVNSKPKSRKEFRKNARTKKGRTGVLVMSGNHRFTPGLYSKSKKHNNVIWEY